MNNIKKSNVPWPTLRVFLVSMFWAFLAYVSIGDAYADKNQRAQQSTKEFEVHYLKQMMNHHLMAVYTSAICQQRAMHADLIALCVRMESAQREEIAIMKEWLQTWYGIKHVPMLSHADEVRLNHLRSLSGEKFEVQFMSEMIPHHAVAINKSLRCLIRGAHEDLLQLCESVISIQANEIHLLRQWLCDWYQRCVLYADVQPVARPMPVKLKVVGI